MLKHLFWIYSLFPVLSSAQNGPGGIGTTDGTSTLELWLSASDFQEAGYLHGDAVRLWPDASGNNSDASNDIAVNRPQFVTGSLNGHSTLHFDRTAFTRLSGHIASGAAPLTAIVVGYYDEIVQTDDTGQFLLCLGDGGETGANRQMTIARQDFNDVNPHELYSYDGAARYRSSTTLAGQTWYAVMSQFNTSDPYYSAFVNNSAAVTTSYGSPGLSATNAYSIGSSGSTSVLESFLNGSIAEVIIFSSVLTDVQRNLIHNYLSAKYSIAIADDLYSGDTNGGFDEQVAGIGRSNSSSHLHATSNALSLTASSLEVGEYLIIGHRSSFNALVSPDIPAVNSARWSRTWYADMTSSDMNIVVDFSFDFEDSGLAGTPSGAANYQLFFNDGSSWSVVATASSIAGDKVIFDDVIVTADGEYALVSSDLASSPLGFNARMSTGNGPASIGSTSNGDDIALWLDATSLSGFLGGQSVHSWPDASGHNRHAVQATPENQPTFHQHVNGFPVIRFDGTDDFLSGSMGDFNAPGTLVAVGYFDNLNQAAESDYMFDVGAAEPNLAGGRASISRRGNDDTDIRTNRFYTFAGETLEDLHYGPLISGQQWHIFTSIYQTAAPYHQLFVDGVLTSTASGNAMLNSNGEFAVGHWSSDPMNPHHLDGDVAEIIIFPAPLNIAQTRILHAHLAAKWNMTISADLYNGDDAVNGDNDYFVTGVGSTTGGNMEVAASSGLYVYLNRDPVNNAFALFGHNAAANRPTTGDISTTSGTIVERLERSWYFTLTGSPGPLDLSFDYSEMQISGSPLMPPSEFVLIHRAGISGDWNIVSSATSILDDAVQFDDVTLSGDGFYTLAVTSGSLPVLLKDWYAQLIFEDADVQVLLHWSTLSEVNSHGFSIERSVDALAWKSLGYVRSDPTNINGASYRYIDKNPLSGKSYYRLKQVDVDSRFEYVGGVKMVSLPGRECGAIAFPNPFHRSVTVQTSCESEDPTQVRIFDITGIERYHGELPANTSTMMIDTDLSPGFYILTLENPNLSKRRVRLSNANR